MDGRHPGRGGLPPQVVAQVVRLLAREERLTDRQISARTGVGRESIRKLRHGIHRSQRGEDRRGAKPVRVRLALELLAREPQPSVRSISRLLQMRWATVRALRDGTYITQRGQCDSRPPSQ